MYHTKAYSAASATSPLSTPTASLWMRGFVLSNPIQKINEVYDRRVKSDVKYRFPIDMASLKSE